MQLRTSNGFGTVDIVTGTNKITGHQLAADWTQAVPSLSFFSLADELATVFVIQTLTDPAHSTSGFWEALLDANYGGPTVTNADYCIHKDFTNRRKLPLFGYGDIQRSQIHNRAMQILDLPDVVGPPMITDFAVTTLDKAKPSLFAKIVNKDGSDVIQWWLLQTGAPETTDSEHDNATSDDATSRWRQVG